MCLNIRNVLFFYVAVSTMACEDKKDSGLSTFATLAVDNSSTSELLATSTHTPTVFGIKMIDVRLMTGLDSTKNPAPVIWYNPECGTETVTQTEVNGKMYDYTQSPGCDLNNVTKFFDFARPTEEVNEDINSQPNKVYPATYMYVSLGFCEGQVVDNVQFQADPMTEPLAGSSGSCGVISAEANPPLVINEGESVVISLKYSIAGMIKEEPGEFCWTSEDAATKRCFSMPQFEASAAKAE